MPVTAKLSRRFYEKFGDEVTNELVEWFNSVDADYRSQLRELNESNFARFDAKVEQRFAESDARLERRFVAADVKLEQRFAASDSRVIRWMFTFWTGSMLAQAAFLYAVLRAK